MRIAYIAGIVIVLASILVGVLFYPQLPAQMASHWNLTGQANGYTSTFWGTFLLPLIAIGVFALFVFIPRIDPLKENIKKFRTYFDVFMLLILLFLFYLDVLSILWNLGAVFSMTQMLTPAFAILFYAAGVLIQHTKQNWFIGIRTPWTLSNKDVWEKTHRIGGVLFKVSGFIALIGVLFPALSIYFIVIPVLATAVFTFIYSYIAYRNIKKS